MNGKFIIYALVVSLLSTTASWSKLLSTSRDNSGSSSGYRGSSWNSNTGGGSWGGGGGGHK